MIPNYLSPPRWIKQRHKYPILVSGGCEGLDGEQETSVKPRQNFHFGGPQVPGPCHLRSWIWLYNPGVLVGSWLLLNEQVVFLVRSPLHSFVLWTNCASSRLAGPSYNHSCSSHLQIGLCTLHSTWKCRINQHRQCTVYITLLPCKLH